MNYIFSLLSCVFLLIGTPDDINKAIQAGDATGLKKYMNETIELVTPNDENVYSKVQAEQILKGFFAQNKPVSFKVLHNGISDQSQYYIGTLKTEGKQYRVYYLVKQKADNLVLYQLRIENDE